MIVRLADRIGNDRRRTPLAKFYADVAIPLEFEVDTLGKKY